MKRLLLIVVVLGLLAVEPLLSNLRFQQKMEDASVPSTSEFLLRFLGEIRYTLAAYLWLKVEIYHHELNLTTLSATVGGEDPKKVGEILALCRLVTRLDPQFIQAYDVGSWRLSRGLGKFQDAADFLEEGLRNNPDNPVLVQDMAELYVFYEKNCVAAIPYLEKTSILNPTKQAQGNDLRLLGSCYDLLGQPAKSIDTYLRLQALFPDDPIPKLRIKAVREKYHLP